jgi:integrase
MRKPISNGVRCEAGRKPSIRLLRWSDVDLNTSVIRWRGENDKIGFEHETPLTRDAVAALDAARRERPSVGDPWIFAS